MTAPDGSYVIGGANWGQDSNETLLNQLVGGYPTPDNPFFQIEQHLLRMPIEALRVFQPFIPGARAADFNNQQSAAETVIGTFFQNGGKGGLFQDLTDKIQEVIDNLFDGWIGNDIGTGGSNPTNVHVTSDQIRESIQKLNDKYNELIAANNNGVVENFGTYPNGGLGPKWVSWHSGLAAETISIKDGFMYLLQFPLVLLGRKGFTRYKDKSTTSDYQRIGCAFASAPQQGLSQNAGNYMLGRVSSQFDTNVTSTYVWAKIEVNKCSIGCTTISNGQPLETTFSTSQKFRFSPGSAYWFEVGDKAANDPYTFRLFRDSVEELKGVDTNRKSFVGSTHRFTGLGFDNPLLQSGKISSFVMFDSK